MADEITETPSEPGAESVDEITPDKTKPMETEIQPEPIPEPEQPKQIHEVIPVVAVIPKSKSLAREPLVKARSMIQFRKRKKLDKIPKRLIKKGNNSYNKR